MPDLSTMYPTIPQPQVAGGIDGVMAGMQFNDAQRNNVINQVQALQNMYKQQQTMPADIQQAYSNVGLTNAQTRGQNANAAGQEYDLQEKQFLQDPRRQAMISDFATKMSTNDIQKKHNELEAQLMDPDPAVREQAQRMYWMTGAMLQKKAELDTELQKAQTSANATLGAAGIGANAALKSMQMQIDAGRFAQNQPWYLEMKQMQTLPGQIALWNTRKQQAAQQLQQYQQGTPEYAQAQEAYNYAAKEEQTARNQAGLAATASAGVAAQKSPNISALGQNGVLQGITPPQAPTVVTPGAQPQQVPKQTLSDVQRMYPGVPADKLKQAYKAKFGVDLE